MKKIGLALAGGGARGAYQIGAWKAMREFGIIDLISAYSGVSVGAMNAALFAMNDYKVAYKVWHEVDSTTLFRIDKHFYKKILKEKMEILNKGIYGTENLENLLEEIIDFEKIKGKEVYIATTHLGGENGKFFNLIHTNFTHYFKLEKQIRYYNIAKYDDKLCKKWLLASSAIPLAFHPVKINDETFYDGGLLDNVPYQPLIDAKCTDIIVIDLFRFSFKRKKKVDGVNIYTVYPHKNLHGILDFNKKHFAVRFELGYIDTKKVLEEIIDKLK